MTPVCHLSLFKYTHISFAMMDSFTVMEAIAQNDLELLQRSTDHLVLKPIWWFVTSDLKSVEMLTYICEKVPDIELAQNGTFLLDVCLEAIEYNRLDIVKFIMLNYYLSVHKHKALIGDLCNHFNRENIYNYILMTFMTLYS
jgi:hypothetical protein